ncbi:FAD-binding oxidoreductase [Homoserinimonas sp. OAct 916]|uniref:NAD(P)/FAD-dependent oxidoreductase n=1 Tax=Homoserinimonas sp. OAct 916 TaxID=2211450 RepID=UPI000DBEA498|nr:FAD-binding oxidoreductase [Homoserinimonas sp. OAct 916]
MPLDSHQLSEPICVVGAGILGASAALHLVRAGATDVTIVDAVEPLGGTTEAGAGFVAAFAADSGRRFDRAAIAMAQYSIEFYKGLRDAGHEIEFAANGNLVLATTEKTLERIRTGILDHPDKLPGTRELTPAEIGEISGGTIDPDAVLGGVYLAEGIQLTTRLALLAVLADLETAGVTFRFNERVTGFTRTDDAVTGVETDTGHIPAARVVLACGAWSADLLADLGWPLPLVPVVATRFVTDDCGLPSTMPTVQCLDFELWLRELHGAFSWGLGPAYRSVSALEKDGVTIGRDRPVVEQLIQAQRECQASLEKVFPKLRGTTPAEIIQGIPVYTVDGNFYVGPVPDCAGIWVLAGDNESGVTHGPAMGRLVSELIVGAEPFVDPHPFRLDRTAPDQFSTEESVIAAFEGDRIASILS